jgi:hypothetical protein
MTKPLSPAAQAIAWAYNNTPTKPTGNYYWLAAALRVAADQIEDLYCDSDVDDSPGIVFALRQLMLIADELEGVTSR